MQKQRVVLFSLLTLCFCLSGCGSTLEKPETPPTMAENTYRSETAGAAGKSSNADKADIARMSGIIIISLKDKDMI